MNKINSHSQKNDFQNIPRKWLKGKSYYISNSNGCLLHSLNRADSIGILYKDPKIKPRKRFFGLVEQEPRKIFLGVIWFDNHVRNANKENWVFEVYGKEYFTDMKELAEDMAKTFEIKITLQLTRENPLFEHLD